MKIALLTLPLQSNYGGILQAYALKSYLAAQGHEVWLIDNRKKEEPIDNSFLKTVLRRAVETCFHRKEIFAEWNTDRTLSQRKSGIEQFIYKHLSPKTMPAFDAEDYKELVDAGNFDLYIVGSDQVWRPKYAQDPTLFFFSFLDGTPARRIAYAASLGASDCEYTPEQREVCSRLLSQFAGVSVREQTAVGQCRDYFGCGTAQQVLDPTMLLKAGDYRRLFENTAGIEPNVYCYVFGMNPLVEQIVNRFARGRDLQIIRTSDKPAGPSEKMPRIEEWLAGIHNARYVITDSFHACVFCILFHTPFVAYINKRRGAARIQSLLAMFGLEERIITSSAQHIEVLELPIDWQRTERILEQQRRLSEDFLGSYTAAQD